MSFTERHALVVGGTSGIGLATATLLASQGARVTVAGRDEQRLRAADALEGISARHLDASSPEQVRAFLAEAGQDGIDYLVLALSGGSGAGPLATVDLNDLREAFEAKFWLHLSVLQAALPYMAKDGSATLITASSARAALPGTAGLAAVNGALEAVIAPLAVELAPLRVNAVSPGVIDTPWWHAFPAEQRQEMFDAYGAALPVGRVGRAEEVAQAVVLAATNGFMTGTVVEVNGGLTLAG
ncbi:SDR family oxidoreductase [Nonomuraea sp. NPDC050556]|uniref:SDR family oxidoreductase n=1 Tax=Nonomuraea sp. NPDC050556 TaxID=3364369 RepID=UPI0037AE9DE9